jgi:predicted metalloprotease with PDZ domain
VLVQSSPSQSREESPFEADLEPSSLHHYPMSTNSSVAAFATTTAFDRTLVAATASTTVDDPNDDAGMGIELVEVEGALVVDTVTHNSPAYHAGLKATDCVLCVDGAVVNTLDEFADNVTGKRSCVLSVVAGGGKALLAGEALSDALLRNLEDVLIEW